VRLRQFQENTTDELEVALNTLESEGIDALVIDLRSNPGGLLNSAVEVSDKFLDKGKLIVYTEGRKKNQDMRFVAHQDFTHPNYPIAVLVNHGSASASEIVAGALQANARAIIIGTQTYGKGSVQSVIPLSDNSGLRLTTALYYTPDGKSIHEKGITPDIIVPFENPKDGEGKNAKPSEESEDQENVPEEETVPEKPQGQDKEQPLSPEEEIAKILKEDNQLQRAVDVLKGILIFEKQQL